jgi:hypothetical protein
MPRFASDRTPHAFMPPTPRIQPPRDPDSTTAPGRPQANGARPSETVRAAVTVALAVYLLGLLLTIAGNTSSGSSALVRTLKDRLFAPWMVPAWLDLGFDYRLTYGGEEDADSSLEVRRFADAASRNVQRLPGSLRGERGARWRRLARSIALAKDDADRDGLLAAAVGRGMFGQLGADDLVVRVVRTPVAERGAAPGQTTQAYSARVRMIGGELQLLRSEPRAELAPLVQPAAAEAAP